MAERLTKEQAAIIGAFTGILAGPFGDMHEYIETILERPVWTHELASEAVTDEIKAKAKADFFNICHDGEGGNGDDLKWLENWFNQDDPTEEAPNPRLAAALRLLDVYGPWDDPVLSPSVTLEIVDVVRGER